MLKIFILSLFIFIFFSVALVLKMLVRGEENINGAGCSGDKGCDPSGCSLCEQRSGNISSLKKSETAVS